jgi:hypothetical protein
MTTTGKNRIMIFGPKTDGTYVVEFRTAEGEALAISIPRTETAVIRHFQERMPYGLFVPDVLWGSLAIRPKIETWQTDATNDTPVVETIFAQWL